MKKGILFGIIFAVLALLIFGYFWMNKTPVEVVKPSGSSAGQGTVAGQGSAVSINGFKFNPTTVNINVRESVTWTNEDSAPHQIVSDSGDELSSEIISTSGTYTHTFKTAGTYEYHCAIHTSMKGKVVVS